MSKRFEEREASEEGPDPSEPSGRPARRRQRRFVALFAALSLVVAFAAAEIGYRMLLYRGERIVSRGDDWPYVVQDQPSAVRDEIHGERVPSNRQAHRAFVHGGKVVGCVGVVLSSNEDGLDGNTTFAEYEQAQIRMLTFGDSVTRWYRDGWSLPDLVEDNLQQRLGVTVANLNYARGSYGILQMFSLAADKIEEHAPDLAIIQFITDDMARGRYWLRTRLAEDGMTTLTELSSAPDGFEDPGRTFVESFVNPSANAEWCTRAFDDPNDAVVVATEAVRERLVAERRDLLKRHYADPWRLFSLETLGLSVPTAPQILSDLPIFAYTRLRRRRALSG